MLLCYLFKRAATQMHNYVSFMCFSMLSMLKKESIFKNHYCYFEGA